MKASLVFGLRVIQIIDCDLADTEPPVDYQAGLPVC
jgi:hypothetical protein